MPKIQKIILIHSRKGGTGASTIAATIARKLSKPKRTVLVTLCSSSEHVYNKSNVKANVMCLDDLGELVQDMCHKNKILKKYEYILFDLSGKVNAEALCAIYSKASLVIHPTCLTAASVSSVEKLLGECVTGDINCSKVHVVVNCTKAHYNAEIASECRKSLDKCCKHHKISVFPYCLGYSKSIESPKRILDSKDCKQAILHLVTLIKELPS